MGSTRGHFAADIASVAGFGVLLTHVTAAKSHLIVILMGERISMRK